MIAWLKNMLDFAFPATCHVCDGKLAPHERFVCTHCLSTLPRTGFHRRSPNPMEERLAGRFRFEKATGHFFYSRDSAFSTLIQDMKYRNYPAIGNLLGKTVAEELFPTGFFSDIDLIVPVPMHYLKQAVRGYNQTFHIADGLGEALGIEVSHSLKAIKSHQTQTSLSGEQRRVNTSGIFKVEDGARLEGKHLLLLDDICTTGATLSSAGEAINVAVPSARLTVMTLGVTF